jgi:hypothetical protein
VLDDPRHPLQAHGFTSNSRRYQDRPKMVSRRPSCPI